ncbi:hypothetical protein Bbelb_374490 [Branchiostoma belcheri]|nr:hypothetical protein Bbelb_374490 [Branchiostoma belcheri]
MCDLRSNDHNKYVNSALRIGQYKTSSENLPATCRVPAGYRPKRPMPARLLNPAGASRATSPTGTGIRPRIFRIRHPWSGTLCQNSQGRCGNHCKKREEAVKTPLVPGRGSNPQPPGPQSDTLTAPLKGLDPFAGSVGTLQLPHRDVRITRFPVGLHRDHYKTSSENLPGTCWGKTNEGAQRPLQGSVKATFNFDHDSRCPADPEPGRGRNGIGTDALVYFFTPYHRPITLGLAFEDLLLHFFSGLETRGWTEDVRNREIVAYLTAKKYTCNKYANLLNAVI